MPWKIVNLWRGSVGDIEARDADIYHSEMQTLGRKSN